MLKLLQVLVLLAILTLATYGQAQSDPDYWEKKKKEPVDGEEGEAEEEAEEEPVWSVIDISEGNWREHLLVGREEKRFVIFQDIDCRACRRGATELAKLANMTQGNITIGRVDCVKSEKTCKLFMREFPKDLPFMVYIKDTNMFLYNGTIDAEEIDAWFRAGHEVHNETTRGNVERYTQATQRHEDEMAKRDAQSAGSYIGRFIPRATKESFDYMFRGAIRLIFHTLGLDHYSKTAKITLFVVLFIIPVNLMTVLVLLDSCFRDHEEDAVPKLIPINQNQVQGQVQNQSQDPQYQARVQALSQQPQQQTVAEAKEMYKQQAEYYKAQAKACEAYVEHLEAGPLTEQKQAAQAKQDAQQKKKVQLSPQKKNKKK